MAIKAKGVDIAKYQPNVDFLKLKNEGYSFVIIRAGYRGYGQSGVLATDPVFAKHMRGAIAAGLDIGVYWFTQAITEAEAEQEAAYCMKLVEPYRKHITMPIYDDVEWANSNHDGRADGLSKAQYTANALAFCEAIVNGGYKAGLYSCEDWLRNKLDLAPFARKKYSIWAANFSRSPNISEDYDIWQYTSKLRTAAIPGVNVDGNYSYVAFSKGDTTPAKWEHTAKGWRYGNMKERWHKINSKWYWFDSDGYAVTGAHIIKNKPYYFLTAEDAKLLHQPECSCFELSK